MSENRKRIKSGKIKKSFSQVLANKILQELPFNLTNSQYSVLGEINDDLISDKRMFRILQGDVGSGKTIVAFISIANVIENNYQCALMAPTEILSLQHYELAKKIFKNTDIKIAYLSGKTENKQRKKNFS